MRYLLGLAALASIAGAAAAQSSADERAFFDIYKEMVETNTTLSAGSCTQAATQVADRLTAAGYRKADVTVFSTPEKPRDGGVVAVLPGTDAALPAMLLLGHLDVVEAKREDWKRDPFKLTEENGFYYARGAADDKAMSAIWADTMIRLKKAGPAPRRTIRLALTCGEETTYAFNGADWLTANRPDLVKAGFVLNEGGGGRLTPDGKRQALSIQVGEKAAQNFTMVAINPGGHSSQPTPDNAIYELADAVKAIQGYEFPIRFTDTTRAFFAAAAKAQPGEMGQAITRLVANPDDAAANAVVSRDKLYHSVLRTTCVVTLLDAGHAENALPQRASGNVNCRIFPGETVAATTARLQQLAGDKVKVTANQPIRPLAVAPRMDPAIIGPMTRLAERHFPGVPVVPTMSTGATDGVFFGRVNTPVYGVPGIFGEAEGNGAHGLDERMRVRSLYEGRAYLFDLVKTLADPAA